MKDDISEVASLYKTMMVYVNKLAGFKTRPRAERVAFDIQISGGKLKDIKMEGY
jgi:hypothetical protein